MRRLFVTVLALVILALPAAVAAGGRPFVMSLTGAAEVPSGDPDGSGTASLTINSGQGEVCWTIVVADIALPATGAHIHIGDASVAGPVVVPLSSPDADGLASGCTSADKDLLKDIIQAPWNYYVNVHSTEFPGGAVRGQLSR
jgi:hypothetical protein